MAADRGRFSQSPPPPLRSDGCFIYSRAVLSLTLDDTDRTQWAHCEGSAHILSNGILYQSKKGSLPIPSQLNS